MATARAGLERLDELQRAGKIPVDILDLHRRRLEGRLTEFTPEGRSTNAGYKAALFRQVQCDVIEAERAKLIELRARGKIDNTVLRRLQRVFDLGSVEIQVLDSTGQIDLEE